MNLNYPNLLKMIISRSRGFWRIGALSRLNKKINQGQIQLEYVKNLITITGKNNHEHSFFKVTSLKTKNDNSNSDVHSRSKSSQTFFVTQFPPLFERRINNFNKQLFMNKKEEDIYNPIELHPFEVKFTRYRDTNQKFFNVQEIKKEIEKNYNYIRNKQIKQRPYTSIFKNKINKNLFEESSRRNSNININSNNYFSENIETNKKGKKGLKINFNSNLYNNTINSNFINLKDKKRVISAYFNGRSRQNFFTQDNKLIDNFKTNKVLLNNEIRSNTIANNNLKAGNTIIEDFYSNKLLQRKGLFDKFNLIRNIPKNELKKRIFSSISSDDRKNMNSSNNKEFKTASAKNKFKFNNFKKGKNAIKLNYFNTEQSLNRRGFKLSKFKTKNGDIFINKESSIKIK